MRKLVKRSLFTISSRLSEKRSAYITNCDSLYKACSLYLSLNCDDKSRGLHDLLVRHQSSWSLTSKCSSLTRGTWFHMTIIAWPLWMPIDLGMGWFSAGVWTMRFMKGKQLLWFFEVFLFGFTDVWKFFKNNFNAASNWNGDDGANESEHVHADNDCGED